MKKRMLSILAYIPLVVYIIFALIVLFSNSDLNYTIMLLSIVLLFLMGFGILRKEKLFNVIGIISLSLFTIMYAIMGYFDYIKWLSTIVAIIILIYFLIIYFLKIKIIKN